MHLFITKFHINNFAEKWSHNEWSSLQHTHKNVSYNYETIFVPVETGNTWHIKHLAELHVYTALVGSSGTCSWAEPINKIVWRSACRSFHSRNAVMLGDYRLTTVWTMACIGSSRLCTRLEKWCQLGHSIQVRRKTSTFVRIKQFGVQPFTRTLVQSCQVSVKWLLYS